MQASVTVWLNPPLAATVSCILADWPAVIVTEPLGSVIEKADTGFGVGLGVGVGVGVGVGAAPFKAPCR